MKTAQKHLAAIKAGAVTKTNVIGIRKAINHAERLRNGWSGNRSTVTPDEADELEEALRRHEPAVMGELHDSGLKLLRSPRYAKRWNDAQRLVIHSPHVIFSLVGYDRVGNRDQYAVPVYRVASFTGNFLFRNVPWQSGGNGPEIVEDL